ncbi:hypothetical protein F4811DRAFT_289381 [Daldinia bambusicola]|nr:hypothetical protein F4811DRAFT_289381 [Daldinia bambusicola]
MSPTSSSHNSAVADSISKPDRDCVGKEGYDHFYIDKFTEERPPHLNNKNFSCTQPAGSATQPRRCPMINKDHGAGDNTERVSTDSDENYTFIHYAPSSSNTNETLKCGDPFVYRLDLDYYKNHNYAVANSAQPLTMAAVAALDYTNHTQSFDGNVYGWPPRAGRAGQADPADYWSTSHLMTKAPESRSSMATSMSWCVVPSAQEHDDAAMLRDIGGWSDIPADPRTAMARSIRDEDVFEA